MVSAVGTLGYVHIVEGTKKFYYKDAYILCFENHFNLNPKYTKLVIESDYTQKVIYGGSKGTTVDQLTIENAKDLFIPFPPAEEQERIVLAYEKALEQIKLLEQNKSDLQISIKQAKSKILDLAIHGKLVPQDPTDEPAEELLKRIATSDNRPYKKLDEDDGPFEIPKTWTWCRIKEIAKSELGKTLDAKKNKGELYNYLCALNVKWFSFDFSTIKQIRLEEKEKERYLIRKGDLLICEGGDVGRAAIWESDKIIYYQNALHRVRFYENINQYFYLYVLNYYKTLGFIDDVSSGVTIKHFTQNSMNKLYFPLPPIKEQCRIVSKIEELFLQLDTISDQLA